MSYDKCINCITWHILNFEKVKGTIKINVPKIKIEHLVKQIQRHTKHLIEFAIVGENTYELEDEIISSEVNHIIFVSYYNNNENPHIYPDQKFYKLLNGYFETNTDNTLGTNNIVAKVIRSNKDDVHPLCEYILIKFCERMNGYLYAYVDKTGFVHFIKDDPYDIEKVLTNELFMPPFSFEKEYKFTPVKKENSIDLISTGNYVTNKNIHDKINIYPDQSAYKLGIISIPIQKNKDITYEKNIVKILRTSDEEASVNKYILIKLLSKKKIVNYNPCNKDINKDNLNENNLNENNQDYLYAYVNLNTKEIAPIGKDEEDVEKVLINELFIPAISLDPQFKLSKYAYKCYFEKEYDDCHVCLTNKANMYGFCNCTSMRVCEKCTEKINKCPVCKDEIYGFEKVELIR